MNKQAIIDEARTWLGTKWIHNQALKGGGADCSQFVIAVFKNVGLLPKTYKSIKYNRDWALHNSESKLLIEVKKYCKQVNIKDLQAGDILLYKSGKCASHIAIYLGNDKLIHSKIRAGVVEAYIWEHKKDLVSAWRYING